MKQTKKNRTKSLVFLLMTMGTSALYVFAPFHKEIQYVCHNIAHFIEAPNSMLEHDTLEQALSHKAHDHDVSHSGHDHQFMDFLGTLLEKSPTGNNPMQANSFELKIDKHLATVYQLKKYAAILCLDTEMIWNHTIEVSQGYHTEIYVPPKAKLL